VACRLRPARAARRVNVIAQDSRPDGSTPMLHAQALVGGLRRRRRQLSGRADDFLSTKPDPSPDSFGSLCIYELQPDSILVIEVQASRH
jgi:hypothetical protein